MNHLYGLKWNDLPDFLCPIRPMTEKRARKAWHKPDEVFSVSAGPDLEPGKVPAYTLTVGVNEIVLVDHYHPDGSVAVSHFYRAESTIRDGSRLFLTDVSVRDEDRATSYEYRPDGWARTHVYADDGDTVYEFTGLDVSGHWIEPGLSWGDWDRIGLHQPDYVRLDLTRAAKVTRL